MPDLRESLDLLDMSVAASDRPSYIENIGETLLQNQLDALEQSYAQHGTIGPDPMYDEEGNIIPEELWGPDISFAPLISPKNISRGLVNLWQKLGSNALKGEKIRPLEKIFLKGSKAMIAAENKARALHVQGKEQLIKQGFLKEYPYHHGDLLLPPGKRIGKTVRKVQDEVAKELGSKKGFKRYLNTLLEQDPLITPSTNLPANRVRKNLINRMGEDKNLYHAYKNAVIDNINRTDYKVAINIDPSKKIGMDFRGLFTGPWYGSGYSKQSVFERGISALTRKSTKVHEFTHAAQLGRRIPKGTLKGDEYGVPFTSVTGQIREQLFRAAGPKGSSILTETLHDEERFRRLAGFQKLIDKNIKPDAMERIDIFRGFKKSPEGSKGGGNIGRFDNYLRSWYEVTARIGEMRHAEKLGKNYKQTGAYSNLRRLFDDKFITLLKDKYWAAAPVGLGMEAIDDEMYKDLR